MIELSQVVLGFNRAGLSCVGIPLVNSQSVTIDLQRPGSSLVFEQTIDLVELARHGSLELAVEAAAWRIGLALKNDGGSV